MHPNSPWPEVPVRVEPGRRPRGLTLPAPNPHAVTLRAIAPGDEEVMFRVYASTREAELAPVPWSERDKEAFLRYQFGAQHAHYTEHHGDADFLMIERAGERVGRLYLDRRPGDIRIVDIALLPEHRGTGIGSYLLEAILAEARDEGVRVSIHVEHQNPARRLYERLGFREEPEASSDVYALMYWTPPGSPPR